MASDVMTKGPRDRRVPGWLRRKIGDPLAKRLMRLVPTSKMGVLWTTRRDGGWRTTALALWPRNGERYLVALFGETYWVRDLRSGRPARLEVRGKVEDVVLEELTGEGAVDFWHEYANRFNGPARRYANATRRPDRAEAARLAASHAVFRIVEPRLA